MSRPVETSVERKLRFEAPGGVMLAGVLHLPERPAQAGVVICHGMMSSKDSPKHQRIAERLALAGYTVLRFDFSGRGESEGDLLELTFTRQVLECRAAMSQLGGLGLSRISLVGSSMGGAAAILATPEEEVTALVTMAAVGRADLLPERVVGKKDLRRWQSVGSIRLQGEQVGWKLVEDSRRIDVLAAASRVHCPWLMLHGERDEVVPVSDAQSLLMASQGRARLEIVPGADHRFSTAEHLGWVIDRVVSFIGEACQGTG